MDTDVDPIRLEALRQAGHDHRGNSAEGIVKAAAVYEDYLRGEKQKLSEPPQKMYGSGENVMKAALS